MQVEFWEQRWTPPQLASLGKHLKDEIWRFLGGGRKGKKGLGIPEGHLAKTIIDWSLCRGDATVAVRNDKFFARAIGQPVKKISTYRQWLIAANVIEVMPCLVSRKLCIYRVIPTPSLWMYPEKVTTEDIRAAEAAARVSPQLWFGEGHSKKLFKDDGLQEKIAEVQVDEALAILEAAAQRHQVGDFSPQNAEIKVTRLETFPGAPDPSTAVFEQQSHQVGDFSPRNQEPQVTKFGTSDSVGPPRETKDPPTDRTSAGGSRDEKVDSLPNAQISEKPSENKLFDGCKVCGVPLNEECFKGLDANLKETLQSLRRCPEHQFTSASTSSTFSKENTTRTIKEKLEQFLTTYPARKGTVIPELREMVEEDGALMATALAIVENQIQNAKRGRSTNYGCWPSILKRCFIQQRDQKTGGSRK
jgi:hypothetical protein